MQGLKRRIFGKNDYINKNKFDEINKNYNTNVSLFSIEDSKQNVTDIIWDDFIWFNILDYLDPKDLIKLPLLSNLFKNYSETTKYQTHFRKFISSYDYETELRFVFSELNKHSKDIFDKYPYKRNIVYRSMISPWHKKMLDNVYVKRAIKKFEISKYDAASLSSDEFKIIQTAFSETEDKYESLMFMIFALIIPLFILLSFLIFLEINGIKGDSSLGMFLNFCGCIILSVNVFYQVSKDSDYIAEFHRNVGNAKKQFRGMRRA